MKTRFLLAEAATLLLSACLLPAQDNQTEVERLRRQLEQTQDRFEKALQEQREEMRQLQQRLDALQSTPALATNPPAAAPATAPLGPPPPTAAGPTDGASPGPANRSWQLSDPIRIGRGSAYLDLGLVGTFAVGGSTADDIEGELELGGHDPNQRGFTVQGVEATFSGAVDPYFRGLATVTFNIDAGGETATELEEAHLESVSLPANLQVRAGQYLTEFGRHNTWHLHSWHFVDTPLVNGRLLGPDGLRNPGARLSWLMPLPFYSELFLNIQNSQGETAASFRSEGGHHQGGDEDEKAPFAYREAENDRGVQHLDDLLLGPRYAVSFDLTEAQVLLLGGSAAFGPNSSGGKEAGSTRTQIYGLDLTWKWKPVRHSGGFPFVQWQTEGMWRRYDAGAFDWDLNDNGQLDPGEIADPTTDLPANLPGETLDDRGFYTQLLYGIRKGWVAGLRWDYVTSQQGDYEERGLTLDGQTLGRDPARATRWRLAPNLTFYPTEFSKIRLQYNYDHRKGIGEDHTVWLQFEFVLGAHAAHKF
jgi:hypothetical protein